MSMQPNDDQILLSQRLDSLGAAGVLLYEIFSLVFDPSLCAVGPRQGLTKSRDKEPKSHNKVWDW